MRPVLYFLAGLGAATVVWHGYMRGWNRVVLWGFKNLGKTA